MAQLFQRTLGRDAWSLEALLSLQQDGQVWIVEQEYTLAGAMAFLCEPFAFRIVQIAVDPLYRHRGYGRDLVHSLVEEARRQGYPALVAEVRMENHEAIAFYKKLGFQVFPRALRYPDGSPGAVVSMEVHP